MAVSSPSADPTWRDFLYVTTGVVGAVGAAAALVPLVAQMNPDASTIAAGGPIELDLGKVQPGQLVLVRWRSRPILVVNRPAQALKTLQDPQLLDQLADPRSDQRHQPPYAQNWHRSVKPEYHTDSLS
jgi:ubiquinol-cytochrome c reductase iron-sulfur subunit